MSETIDSTALATLLETIGGDKAFVDELIETFLEDAPGMLNDMDQAVSEKDAVKLRLVSHSLKTNSAQFGATVLFELCRDIEIQAKEGNLAATQVAEARAEFEKVRQALENLREV